MNNYKNILILVAALLFFYRGILQQNAFIIGNQSLHNYFPWKNIEYQIDDYNYENNWWPINVVPFHYINENAFSNGFLPLWNPFNSGGVPHLANFQSGYFYPLNLLQSALGVTLSINWIIILKTLIAGIGLLFLLSYLNINNNISLLASTVWMFNGFHHTWLSFAHINSVILLPWLVLFSLKLIKGSYFRDKNGVMFSVLYCFMWFGGHPETSIYISLGLFLFVIIYLWTQNSSIIKGLLKYSVFMISGFLLASIQIFPFIEYMLNSHKFLTNSSDFQSFLPLFSIVNYVFPDIFGNPVDSNFWAWDFGPSYFSFAEITGYIGILPILLIVLTLKRSDLKSPYLLTGIAIIPFIYYVPLVSDVIKLTPFLNIARASKGIIWLSFVLTLLFAHKLQELLRGEHKLNIKAITIFSVSLLFLSFIFTFFDSGIVVNASNYFGRTSISDQLSIMTLLTKNSIQLVFIAIALVIIMAMSLMMGKIILKKIIFSIVFILLFSDSYFHFQNYNAFSYSDQAYPDTKITNFLKTNIRLYERIYCLEDNIIPANLNIPYGISSLHGHDAMGIPAFNSIMKNVDRNFNSKIISKKNVIELDDRLLIDKMNIRYVLTTTEKSIVGFNKVFESNNVKIWENPQCYGLVTFNDGQSVRPLSFNYIGNTIKIDIPPFGTGGRIYMSENYFPGWKAYLDNNIVPIIKDADFGKNITVTNNAKMLVLKYQPVSFVLGLWISTITFAGLFTLAALHGQVIRKPQNKLV